MSTQQSKAKGVVDIVFLIDITGSMQPCIDALKENIAGFLDYLNTGDANNGSPVKDWRAKAVGFRDFIHDEVPFADNPFVRNAAELKTQLAQMHAEGGEDEAESALDAIYKLATLPQSDKGEAEDPFKWRYRSSAARVVVLFTDASFHETMSLPEAKGGIIDDVFNQIMANRIVLSIFAPDMPCYDKLSAAQKSEFMPIEYDKSDPRGAQKALAAFTKDRGNFKEVLKQLAASVSKSAESETPLL